MPPSGQAAGWRGKGRFKETLGSLKSGQSVEQIANGWKLPAKYAGYTDPLANEAGRTRLRNNVQVIFDELR